MRFALRLNGTTACSWDTVIPFEPLWAQYKRLIKDNGAIVLTGSQPFTSMLIMSNINWFKFELIWEKDVPTNPLLCKIFPLKYHENIVFFCEGKIMYNPIMETRKQKNKRNNNQKFIMQNRGAFGKTIMLPSDGQRNFTYPKSIVYCTRETGLHPTQKPVDLFRYLIKTYSNEGDTILDNCAGSGTTLIAALMENRKSILIEKEKKYFDIMTTRINNYLSQTMLDLI